MYVGWGAVIVCRLWLCLFAVGVCVCSVWALLVAVVWLCARVVIDTTLSFLCSVSKFAKLQGQPAAASAGNSTSATTVDARCTWHTTPQN